MLIGKNDLPPEYADLLGDLLKYMRKFAESWPDRAVGRQVLLDVGGSNFYVDLLFYHLKIRSGSANFWCGKMGAYT